MSSVSVAADELPIPMPFCPQSQLILVIIKDLNYKHNNVLHLQQQI